MKKYGTLGSSFFFFQVTLCNCILQPFAPLLYNKIKKKKNLFSSSFPSWALSVAILCSAAASAFYMIHYITPPRTKTKKKNYIAPRCPSSHGPVFFFLFFGLSIFYNPSSHALKVPLFFRPFFCLIRLRNHPNVTRCSSRQLLKPFPPFCVSSRLAPRRRPREYHRKGLSLSNSIYYERMAEKNKRTFFRTDRERWKKKSNRGTPHASICVTRLLMRKGLAVMSQQLLFLL